VNISDKKKYAQIYLLLKTLIDSNSGSMDIFESVEITGFYSFKTFFELTKKYQQADTVSIVIDGDSTSNPILVAIKKAYSNPALDAATKTKLKTFYDLVNSDFTSTTDKQERLKKFSMDYYQFTKANPEIQEALDSLDLGDWGTLDDLVFVSADIELPEVDCAQADTLLDTTANGTNWNQSVLIQSFYYTYTNWNKNFNFHNYVWGLTQWSLFRNSYINGKIQDAIRNSSWTMTQKHKKIGAAMDAYIAGYNNKQFFYCTPLGDFGTLADYNKCTQNSPSAVSCEVPRGCLGPRNKVIKVDNTTTPPKSEFTEAWKTFVATLDTTEQSNVASTTTSIETIVFGAPPPGGVQQQISQIVTALNTLKTNYPALVTKVDAAKVGTFGGLKKFCACQSTATTQEYTS